MNLMNIIPLLILFEICTSIRVNFQESNSNVDIYQMEESQDRHRLKFINPKQEKPTLREIVYYHLIEKPYQEQNDIKNPSENEIIEDNDEDKFVFDDTMRPFTNSHGFQFLDLFELNDSDVQNTEDKNNEDKIYDEISNENSIETSENPNSTKDITTESASTIVPAENVTIPKQAQSVRDNLLRSPERLRERFQKAKSFIPNLTSTRSKRSLPEFIPDGPTLPPLDYKRLPEYIKNLISTEMPETKEELKNNEVSPKYKGKINKTHQKEIKEDIKNIFKLLKHKFEDIAAGKGETDIERKNKVEDTTLKPRTWGMNLTGNHGEVWNDLWTTPGLHVGIAPQDVVDNMKFEENKLDTNNDISIEIIKDKDDKKPVEEDDKESSEEGEEAVEEDKITNSIPTSLQELMHNDEFWSWLEGWTSTYMELLSMRIYEIIKEEIARQLKENYSLNKCEVNHSSSSDETNTSSDETEGTSTESETDNDSTSEEEGEEEEEKPEAADCSKKVENSKIEVQDTETSSLDPKYESNENSEPPAIDTRFNSNSSNYTAEFTNGLLKRIKKKKKTGKSTIDTKKTDQTKGEPRIIYGNASGNDRVTNIFFFLNSVDTAADILKPIINGIGIGNTTEAPESLLTKPKPVAEGNEDNNENTEELTPEIQIGTDGNDNNVLKEEEESVVENGYENAVKTDGNKDIVPKDELEEYVAKNGDKKDNLPAESSVMEAEEALVPMSGESLESEEND